MTRSSTILLTCDRCGVDQQLASSDPQVAEWKGIAFLPTAATAGARPQSVDLCPECAEAFDEFMGAPAACTADTPAQPRRTARPKIPAKPKPK